MKIFQFLLPALLIGACNQKSNNQTTSQEQITIDVLVDVTDANTLKLYPKANSILSLYGFEKKPKQAFSFNLSVISDLKTNADYEVYLPNSTVTEKQNINDDIQHRKKAILFFQDSVRRIINRFYKDYDTSKSLKFSECWASIAARLENLSQQPQGDKYLIVFSDLQELSLSGNAYKAFNNMTVEAINNKLIAETAIPKNLNGIKLIVVYQPKDRDDDLRFSKMLKVYKYMLEKNGVIISHQANNENFNEN